MKAKPVKHYLPLANSLIRKGHATGVYVWYEEGENTSQLTPYRLQITTLVTRVLKDGTFYTLNSKYIPRRLN